MRLSDGTPCGIDVFSPARAMRSNETLSAPDFLIINSRSSAISFSVMPSLMFLSTAFSAFSVMRCAFSILSVSSAVFIIRCLHIISSSVRDFSETAPYSESILSMSAASFSVNAEPSRSTLFILRQFIISPNESLSFLNGTTVQFFACLPAASSYLESTRRYVFSLVTTR